MKHSRILEWVLAIVGILLIIDSFQSKQVICQLDRQTELILGIISIAAAIAVYYRKTLERDYDNL